MTRDDRHAQQHPQPVTPQATTWRDLRDRNRELRPLGLRVCWVHGGEPLPLDAEHFYRAGDGYFNGVCIPCYRARSNARFREQYATDARFRAKALANNKRFMRAYQKKHRISYYQQVKARQFARLLGAQP